MLYICAKFREIILNGIKVIERTRMIIRGRTDGMTDGRTDTQKFGGYNIIPCHFLWRGIKTVLLESAEGQTKVCGRTGMEREASL